VNTSWAGVLFVATLVAALALAYRPVGDHLARVYSRDRDSRLERGIYRLVGVDPDVEQRWPVYLRSVIG